MEGSSSLARNLSADAAMGLLREGVYQKVEIPRRCMLVSVMESLKSPMATVFDCTDLPEAQGFKATVKIDVSTTRAATDPDVKVKELEGAVCRTRKLAVDSAVKEALIYLASKRFVRIKDHSSKVAGDFPDHHNWISVNTVSDDLKKVSESYQSVLKKYEQIRLDFDVNHKAETKNGVETPVALMYADFAKGLHSSVDNHMAVFKQLKLELDDEMEVRGRYHQETNNSAMHWRLQGYHDVGKVTEKCVLGYLLQYFGMPQAIYGSHYDRNEGFRGYVTLDIPDIEPADCGGQLTFTGSTFTGSREAEDDAAFEALKFFENKLKVMPVDLNYNIRCEAKKNHELLINLLECYQHTAERIRKAWEHLNTCMDATFKYYRHDYKFNKRAEMSEYHLKKLEECAKSLEDVYELSVKEFEVCAVKFKEMEQYKPRRMLDDN